MALRQWSWAVEGRFSAGENQNKVGAVCLWATIDDETRLLDACIYKSAMRQCLSEFFSYSSPERVI